MRPAQVIQIATPKKYILNGLWFGPYSAKASKGKPKKAKRAIIFIHGLTGSAFSMSVLVDALVDSETAVLTFNNRGFEQVGEVKRKVGRVSKWVRAGAGHEVFAECVDDIQGAVQAARKMGAKEIYLAGHSTGAQKAIFWAAQKNASGVKGIILLGPLSDYAGAVASKGARAIGRGVAYARKMVAAGRPHELMPDHLREWFECDAQRYISLYTPDSPEEIFTYAQPKKTPRTLLKVHTPVLVLLAGADEHGDKPAKKIGEWFMQWLYTGHVVIIPRVKHSFKGAEKEVARVIRGFVNSL